VLVLAASRKSRNSRKSKANRRSKRSRKNEILALAQEKLYENFNKTFINKKII